VNLYLDQFLNGDEESRRATVKLLTRAVQSQLVELTINAPDWSVIIWGLSPGLIDFIV
jgi:glycerol-3-phosphate O-acyltransferase/dihydroxyacetone phosphate acyltransferase